MTNPRRKEMHRLRYVLVWPEGLGLLVSIGQLEMIVRWTSYKEVGVIIGLWMVGILLPR